MKKALKIIGLSALAFIVLVILLGVFSDPPTEAERAAAAAAQVEPAPAEEPPSRFIAGMNPVDVPLNLEKHGFTVKKDFGGGYTTRTCKQILPGVEYTAEVGGPGTRDVDMVRAMVMADGVTQTALAGRDFVAFVASVAYTGAQPQNAHDWVVANFDQDGATTTIGGATFTMKAPSALYRMLLIEPKR